MKIVHFIGSIDQNSGGTAVYMQLLAAELNNLTDLLVVTNTCCNPVVLPGIKMKFLNLNLFRWFQIKKEFKKILQLENPDVVHVNGIWDPQNYLIQKEAQKLGIKVIISPHGMLEPYIMKRHPSKKKLALFLYQNEALKSADYLHATAISELDNIRRMGFKQPAAIISNGLDVSEATLKTAKEAENEYKNILFLSRIHPKKGIELLIESISLLKDPKIKVVIAGEGDKKYVDQLIKLTKARKVDHLIWFLGGAYGRNKWDLFEQADIFVLPTFSENFGIVVIEALAVGLPVITTKGTPWQELETYNCGWWIDLNVPNLKKALEKAIDTPKSELERMGQRGRKLVEEKYDSKAVAREMLSLYKKVLKN